MKRICSLFLCMLLVLLLLPSTTCAASVDPCASIPGELTYETVFIQANGWTIVTRLFISENRDPYQRTAAKTTTFYSPLGEQAAEITISGTFSYDGSSVYVLSKSITNLATYNGWHFSLSSFSSSGGTITLSGTLSKALLSSQSISMSLSCDANGNIS